MLKAQQHDELLDRNLPGQHTIDAIAGLREALDGSGLTEKVIFSAITLDVSIFDPASDPLPENLPIPSGGFVFTYDGTLEIGGAVVTTNLKRWESNGMGEMMTLTEEYNSLEFLGRILWSVSDITTGEIPWVRFLTTQDTETFFGMSLPYSPIGHDHDADYAAIDHNHDGDYSALDHNHDADYAAIDHNHDADYSAIDHNHDADYMPIGWMSLPAGPHVDGQTIPVDVPKATADTTSGNVNLILADNNRHGMVAIVNYTGNNTIIVKNSGGATILGGGVAPGEVGLYINASGSSWIKH